MTVPRSPAPAAGHIDAVLRARFGVEAGWSFGHERLVEWRDVHGFRHANHAAFLLWFEAARNRYLEAMGLPRLSPDGPGPVMMTLEARYLKPLAFHDPVLVTARVQSMRRRSEEPTSELQSLMRTSYAVFCLKKKKSPCQTR